MPVLKFDDTHFEPVKPGVQRKIISTDNLMTVLIEFTNGPWDKPDIPHSHPHEQISYIAEGEIFFFCQDEEKHRLTAGDMFAVPPHKQHTIQLISPRARLVDSFTPIRDDFLS